MKPLTRITSLLLICLLTSGCSKSLSQAIVGRWKIPGEAGFFEFFVDNTVLLSDDKRQFSGKWTVVGNNRIKADIAADLGATATLIFDDIHMSGNQLTCTFQGRTIEMKRAQ
jgi:hypothetical protein